MKTRRFLSRIFVLTALFLFFQACVDRGPAIGNDPVDEEYVDVSVIKQEHNVGIDPCPQLVDNIRVKTMRSFATGVTESFDSIVVRKTHESIDIHIDGVPRESHTSTDTEFPPFGVDVYFNCSKAESVATTISIECYQGGELDKAYEVKVAVIVEN